ncbi:MAG: spore gernimation protein [Ruminiclostridium sp.]|nr:spore gernimation protein [Ruminiclostridium sp.]
MEKKINIGKWEAVTILINMINTKILLNFPRKMAEEAGNAGWMLAIYICILAFAGFYIVAKLYRKFEGKDLLDIGEHIGGSMGRVAVGSIIIAFLLYIVSIYVRTFSEDMKIVALTVSPISYVTTFFIVCMVIGAWLGIEAIARYHAIVVPVIAAGYLLIIIGVAPFIEFSNLLPIFGNGAKSIFVDGALKTGIFTELIVLFLLAPFLKSRKRFESSGYTALAISSVLLVTAALVYLAVIPYPGAGEKILPIYHLARMINYGRFFQRLESVFVLIWATAGLMYVTVGLYLIAYLFKKTFGLKYHKPLIFPFAVIIFTLSLLPENLIQSNLLETEIIREWGWILVFVMPMLLLLVGGLIKRKVKRAQ